MQTKDSPAQPVDRDQRAHGRQHCTACLLYADGELSVRDISLGGIGLRLDPRSSLGRRWTRAGEVRFLISAGTEWFGPFRGWVVWEGRERAGLQFAPGSSTDELERALQVLRGRAEEVSEPRA